MMHNIIVVYKIEINVGNYKGKVIYVPTDLDELEYMNVEDILIDKNYLKYWANNDEFSILGRVTKEIL